MNIRARKLYSFLSLQIQKVSCPFRYNTWCVFFYFPRLTRQWPFHPPEICMTKHGRIHRGGQGVWNPLFAYVVGSRPFDIGPKVGPPPGPPPLFLLVSLRCPPPHFKNARCWITSAFPLPIFLWPQKIMPRSTTIGIV